MNAAIPRLRMFAGPNGSGKSTLKSVLPKQLLGVYLNPDEIEREIRHCGFLELAQYQTMSSPAEILSFFADSELLIRAGMAETARELTFSKGRLHFSNNEVNSYFASVSADFICRQLLRGKISFTLETVMSHPGKIDLLKRAQTAGYRTYLYFIATDDPTINISRVRNRAAQGGHAVPEERITSRYYRSLDLLLSAIRSSNRAYIFDNSTDAQDHTWIAEITDGKLLEMKSNRIPAWFKRVVLDKIKQQSIE